MRNGHIKNKSNGLRGPRHQIAWVGLLGAKPSKLGLKIMKYSLRIMDLDQYLEKMNTTTSLI